jgi:hypothetical protein
MAGNSPPLSPARRGEARAPWLPAVVLAGLLFVSGAGGLYGRWQFNQAQILRSRGQIRPELYQAALARLPDDPQVRGEAGAALAAAHDPLAAVAILTPLAADPAGNEANMAILVEQLVAAGQPGAARRLYARLTPPPRIDSPAAARLVADYRQSPDPALPAPALAGLLASALTLAPGAPEFGLIGDQGADPGFWQSPVGQRAQQVLDWQQAGGGRPAIGPNQALPGTIAAPPLRRDDPAGAARLLGLDPAAITVGPELVTTNPAAPVGGWTPALMNTGDPWNRGLFALGTDQGVPGSPGFALRVDGVAIERRADREQARAGFWHTPIRLAAGSAYHIRFAYRTEDVAAPGCGLWLTEDRRVLAGAEQPLPPTNGAWRHVTIVGWNRSPQAEVITPLLRVWSEGRFWFDAFSVRALTVTPPLAPQDAHMAIDSLP